MSMDEQTALEETRLEGITNEALAERLDQLGMQMNWLCENLQSVFQCVQQIGQNGGGLRGMLNTLRQSPPQMKDEAHE